MTVTNAVASVAPPATVRKHGGITFEDRGRDDDVIVLLHGIPGDRSCWRPVAERLDKRHRVLVPDLVGFGDSVPAPPGYHAEQQASALANLLNAVAGNRIHLVGFDFGGPIAVLTARQLADKVRSLVLANTNVFTDTPVPLPLRIARVPMLGAVAYRLFFGRLGLLGMWLAATRRRDRFTAAEFRKVIANRQTVASTQDVFLHSMRDLPGLYAPVQSALRQLDTPTLVVWSDRDPFFDPAVGRRVAKEARDARLLVFEETGHFTPYEQPDGFADAVLAHVAAVHDGRAGSNSAAPHVPA